MRDISDETFIRCIMYLSINDTYLIIYFKLLVGLVYLLRGRNPDRSTFVILLASGF